MYIPKGKRQIFPSGALPGDFVSSKTGLPYEGDVEYNSVTDTYRSADGRIDLISLAETGNLNEDSVVLPPTAYDRLRGDAYQLRVTKHPEKYNIQPTEEDYAAGFVERFFIEHKEKGTITEVDKKTFTQIQGRSTNYHYPSYLVGSLYWKLTGPVANQNVNGYIVQGTSDINARSIRALEQLLPNIRTYLTDPSQFVK